jgi:hypothetical protein
VAPAGGTHVARLGPMLRVRPQRPPALLDVFDRVLGKGVTVTASRDAAEAQRGDVSIAGISLFGFDSRIVVTDFDADELRETG